MRRSVWLKIAVFVVLINALFGGYGRHYKLPPETFFPLWYAGKQIVHHENPYTPEGIASMEQAMNPRLTGSAGAGNGYPMPTVVFFMWTQLLPYSLMVYLLLLAGSLIIGFAAMRLGGQRSLLLCVASMMLTQAYVVGNITFLLFGVLLLLVDMQRRQHWVAMALLAQVLVLKPQMGILFWLATLWILYRQHQWRAIAAGGAFMAALWAISWVMQPAWIGDWLHEIQVYKSVQASYRWILPYGLLLPLAAYKRPWYVLVGILTVLVVPHVAAYGLIPLMLYLMDRDDTLALVVEVIIWCVLLFASEAIFWVVIPLGLSLLSLVDFIRTLRSPDAEPFRWQQFWRMPDASHPQEI